MAAVESTAVDTVTSNSLQASESVERSEDEEHQEDDGGGGGGGYSRGSPSQKPRPAPLDIAAAQNVNLAGPVTPNSATPRTRLSRNEKEKKIGHRRVDIEGQITYKKIQTTQIMGSIQLGISHAVGGLASKPERDVLMQDFAVVETTSFPSQGSNITPAHHYADFKFKTYAPVAFRYFRDLFNIQPDDFLLSMCNEAMVELTNPGASGSIFYVTADDEFIIKTVQHKEGEFLQKLLPGYYMNLNQNPRTLLPKFFGLYCYQCGGKNVRLIVMDNLLPSSIKIHQKYDLKGSTYKRKAAKHERSKPSPTFKDLDFMEHHPEGILLEAETYTALTKTIQRDCRVLASFKIMDYSLLVGIHNLDKALKEKQELRRESSRVAADHSAGASGSSEVDGVTVTGGLSRSRSINRQRLVAHSTAMEAIQADSEPIDEDDDIPSGIPARNAKGERLLLFLGIIDILQSYRLKKKLEHTWKSMLHDGDTVSVHRPGFYAERFQDFMAKTVFKKIPSPLKHSPSRKKSVSTRYRPPSGSELVDERDINVTIDLPADVIHSDIPTFSTPPPPFEEALLEDSEKGDSKARSTTDSTSPSLSSKFHRTHHSGVSSSDPSEIISLSYSTLKTESVFSTHSENSSTTSSGFSSIVKPCTWTPPHSVEGSTPTHTEGTPSFTESSSSGDLGCPTTPVKSLSCVKEHSSISIAAHRSGLKSYQETEMTHL